MAAETTKTRNDVYWILLLILLTLLPRLLIAWLNQDVPTADLERYQAIGETLLSGGNPLDLPIAYYPYPPVWMFFEAAAVFAAQSTNLAFNFVVKLIPITADVLLTLSIFKLTESRFWALAYALNPVPIIQSAMVGQFNALVMFFVIWSVVYVKREEYRIAGLLAGIAIALKWYPAFFVGIIVLYLYFQVKVGLKNSITYAGIACLVWLSITLPFVFIHGPGYVIRPLDYSLTDTFTDVGYVRMLAQLGVPIRGMGAGELPGLAGELFSRGKVLLAAKLFLGVVFLVGLARYRFKTPEDLLIFFFTAFFALAGGGAYYLWLLPFMLIRRRYAGLSFSLAMAIVSMGNKFVRNPRLVMPVSSDQLLPESTLPYFNAIYVAFNTGLFVYEIIRLERQRKTTSRLLDDSIERNHARAGVGFVE